MQNWVVEMLGELLSELFLFEFYELELDVWTEDFDQFTDTQIEFWYL